MFIFLNGAVDFLTLFCRALFLETFTVICTQSALDAWPADEESEDQSHSDSFTLVLFEQLKCESAVRLKVTAAAENVIFIKRYITGQTVTFLCDGCVLLTFIWCREDVFVSVRMTPTHRHKHLCLQCWFLVGLCSWDWEEEVWYSALWTENH